MLCQFLLSCTDIWNIFTELTFFKPFYFFSKCIKLIFTSILHTNLPKWQSVICYYGLFCIELEVKNELNPFAVGLKLDELWNKWNAVKTFQMSVSDCFLNPNCWSLNRYIYAVGKKYFILVLFNSNWIKSVNTYFLRWRNLTPFLGWTSGSPPCFSVSRKPYRMRRVTFADLPLLLFFKS